MAIDKYAYLAGKSQGFDIATPMMKQSQLDQTLANRRTQLTEYNQNNNLMSTLMLKPFRNVDNDKITELKNNVVNLMATNPNTHIMRVKGGADAIQALSNALALSKQAADAQAAIIKNGFFSDTHDVKDLDGMTSIDLITAATTFNKDYKLNDVLKTINTAGQGVAVPNLDGATPTTVGEITNYSIPLKIPINDVDRIVASLYTDNNMKKFANRLATEGAKNIDLWKQQNPNWDKFNGGRVPVTPQEFLAVDMGNRNYGKKEMNEIDYEAQYFKKNTKATQDNKLAFEKAKKKVAASIRQATASGGESTWFDKFKIQYNLNVKQRNIGVAKGTIKGEMFKFVNSINDLDPQGGYLSGEQFVDLSTFMNKPKFITIPTQD